MTYFYAIIVDDPEHGESCSQLFLAEWSAEERAKQIHEASGFGVEIVKFQAINAVTAKRYRAGSPAGGNDG